MKKSLLLAAILASMSPFVVQARQANLEALDRAARSIITTATQGNPTEAITLAQRQRREKDAAFGTHLDEQAGRLTSQQGELGTPIRISTINNSYVLACVRRTYIVYYENAKQTWQFAWSDGVGGFRLTALDVQ